MPPFARWWRLRSSWPSVLRLAAISCRARWRSARRRSSVGPCSAPRRCRSSLWSGFPRRRRRHGRAFSHRRRRRAADAKRAMTTRRKSPAFRYGLTRAAALLALVPASAIVPKISAAGVHLADPIFDHAKIAIIDAMTRQGLPPVDPVFGAGRPRSVPVWARRRGWPIIISGTSARRSWRCRCIVSGWEADIGLTWFTAFASLDLDDGCCRLAQRTIRGRDPGRCSRRGGVAADGAERFFRQLFARTVHGVAQRLCRLAVPIAPGCRSI